MKDINNEIREEIYRICKPHFEKVLQETLSNSMTTMSNRVKIVWRPNNYRRQMEVKTKVNSTIEKIKSAIDSTDKLQININNHTKLISIKNYKPQITIQYGKNTLTGIWSQKIIGGHKQVFLLEGKNIEEITALLVKHKERIEKQIDDALMDFAKKFNIKLPLSYPKHTRSEDMIKGEEYLDNLPADLIIHDTYFRKVYKNELEFKSGKNQPHSAILVKNYLKNRALEEIAPKIEDKLEKMIIVMEKGFENQKYLDKNLVKHFKVLNKIEKAITRLDRTLRGGRFLSRRSKSYSQQQLSLRQFIP